MTAKAETVTTLRYKAVTSKAGYRRLEDCMLLMGRFYNTVIQHREYATSSHRRQWSRKLQNIHLTDFHRHNPEYHEYARKLLEATIKRANLAYERFFKLAEQPGSNVRQKSGLNRGILAQNWGKIRAQLEYKCQWVR